MIAMFSQSTQVIHASAAALNAVRGHNMASPWMNGMEGEAGGIDPLWLQLGREAMKIAGPLLMAGKQPGPAQAAQMMNAPIQRGPAAHYPPQQGYQQPLLTDAQQSYIDPAGPPEDDDYGDYEGMYIADDHIVDDGFEEPSYYNPEMDEYNHDYYAAPGTTELTGAVDAPAAPTQGNPLEGMDPDEVHKHLEKWIDNQQDKSALKNLGINLAQKLF
jgi:hypothetical protein